MWYTYNLYDIVQQVYFDLERKRITMYGIIEPESPESALAISLFYPLHSQQAPSAWWQRGFQQPRIYDLTHKSSGKESSPLLQSKWTSRNSIALSPRGSDHPHHRKDVPCLLAVIWQSGSSPLSPPRHYQTVPPITPRGVTCQSKALRIKSPLQDSVIVQGGGREDSQAVSPRGCRNWLAMPAKQLKPRQ